MSAWSKGLLCIMQMYIIYLENVKYIPREADWLLKTARSLVSDTGVIVRDTRVASISGLTQAFLNTSVWKRFSEDLPQFRQYLNVNF